MFDYFSNLVKSSCFDIMIFMKTLFGILIFCLISLSVFGFTVFLLDKHSHFSDCLSYISGNSSCPFGQNLSVKDVIGNISSLKIFGLAFLKIFSFVFALFFVFQRFGQYERYVFSNWSFSIIPEVSKLLFLKWMYFKFHPY